MIYSVDVERRIGVFDIALSYAWDVSGESKIAQEFLSFHGLRCYRYEDLLAAQLGLDVHEVMQFVFTTTQSVLILNSPTYRVSHATRFEFDIISDRAEQLNIFCFSCGGQDLGLANVNCSGAALFSDFLIRIGEDLES